MGRRLWPHAGVLALCLSIGVGAAAFDLSGWLVPATRAQEAGPPRPVASEIVQDRGEASRWVPGVVAARNQVTMAFQALGRMVRRPVDSGDRVAKGDLLAELATDDLADNTRAAQAAADAAEVQASTAETTLQRTEALASRNVASSAQLEQAQRAAALARAAAEQARSELLRAQDAEGFARLTAPFAGVVSAVFETTGAVVGAGAPILQLSAEDRREVVIDLPESALDGLPTDAVFTIWQRTDPENPVRGTLDRIDPLADTATRTRRLYLTLPQDAPFRLGALVRARLGAEGEPALTVPRSAVFTRDGQDMVWRVIRDGGAAHVEAVPIRAGAEFHGRLLVADGLSPGDEVVIRGVHSLEEGRPVGRMVQP